jgi:hypothetical protein
MWPKNFRDSFCERFNCPPEAYEKRVFWRCLYRRSLPLAAVVYALKPKFFELDFQTIRQLGVTRSSQEFRAELETFRYEYRMNGGFLRQLRLRISGKRMIALLRDVAPPRGDTPQPHPEPARADGPEAV